jgi:predicted ATP-binding protein involved in virulence
MELVYLWVEDYKNIHQQGFNFSPRFRCDFFPQYDKDGKLTEDSKLIICDRKNNECLDKENQSCKKCNNDYVENFFGENINVTAIVGKNGSGKSSLLDLINDMYYENPVNSAYPISPSKITIYHDKLNNKLLIYKNSIERGRDNDFSVVCKSEFEKKIDEEIIIQKRIIQPTPAHNRKEYLLLLDFLRNTSSYFPFEIPKIISIGIHDDFYELLELIKNEDPEFHSYYSPFEEDIDKRFKIFHILLLLAYLKNYKIDFDIKALENHDDTILELEEKIDESFKTKISNYIIAMKDNLEEFSINPSHYIDIKNIPTDFFKTYIDIVKRKNDDELLDFKGKNVFIFNLYPKMSDGQYQLTYLFNMMYSKLSNSDDNILLLIDEGENYLHPNWQKKYISYIVQFITENFSNKNIHIILTSHSPFLLSDIPKQNIIFLDTDEEGNCKVIDGLNEKKETFGANIHTLLSDSFFMENGLMGEFAKSKINEIISFHKEVAEENSKPDKNLANLRQKYEDNKTKFWNTQKIIGWNDPKNIDTFLRAD